MHLEKAKITFVSEPYTVTSKRDGRKSYQRDFVAQWTDDDTGRCCSLSFTIIENLDIMSKLAVNKYISLDYQVIANEWKGRYFNNTRLIAKSIRLFSELMDKIIDPPKNTKIN